jgi:hypothetical protein
MDEELKRHLEAMEARLMKLITEVEESLGREIQGVRRLVEGVERQASQRVREDPLEAGDGMEDELDWRLSREREIPFSGE